ncbi:hypothetical protein [Paenibacillus cymbidii]|uniref:hypothetical protein n=1 Tax=Paenibacillus cymbidii TaxID=1639034 RepID=UPI001436A366|nr:hypothetical protein [Paenibacillus cymbidii]
MDEKEVHSASAEDTVTCQECEKEYVIHDILPFLKAYFKLKPHIELEPNNYPFTRSDSNSTYEAFKGLPDHLKQVSPSSSDDQSRNIIDEGDFPTQIPAKHIFEGNVDGNGHIISPMIAKFYSELPFIYEV